MDKHFYLISDAAKTLKVETHVLRYWEEELGLSIPRNNMGHRIYYDEQMNLFRSILEWKEQGLSLKEISEQYIQHDHPAASDHTTQVIPYPAPAADIAPQQDKLYQFKKILGQIMQETFKRQSEEFTTTISKDISVRINKELDFLFRERDNASEERFRKLDETIRAVQNARKETAATELEEIHQKRRRHRKGKRS